MKIFYRYLLALAALMAVAGANAQGWPSNYGGVMLQGFYWDSYTDTKWTTLESQADELSQYFDLIWVPNSAKAASNGMGYDAVYWFTNHNSRFGSEAQIRSMIQTFKDKGTGIIADCVLNHRSGKSNWCDFPVEQWNGQTWQIGLDGICRDDECVSQHGDNATGAYDTGEHFDGSRDLDHTNANVQNNCKNYVKFLLEDMGYAGVRLDMVKGYSAQYVGIYNNYAKPRFSVGEYWDGSYDALAAWIEGTGKTSAAFDFAFKYACNEAFGGGNLAALCWKANGTTDQPAGLIHWWYPQYAVTFLDNHDTCRDDWNKFNGNVAAANAFMLCSPGTPCVFLKHWKSHKAEIKKMIEARKKAGVHNQSQVNVLKTNSGIYMAEVIGTKGKLVVKIGSSMEAPAGYSDSDVYCYGTDYCIWVKAEGGVNPPNPPQPGDDYPATLYLQGHVNGYEWSTSQAVPASGNNGAYTFSGVTINKSSDSAYGFFSFCTTIGASWDAVNSGDRYGAGSKDEAIAVGGSSAIVKYAAGSNASDCKSWALAPGTYTITADLKNMKVTVSDGTGEPTPPTPPIPGDYPSSLYLLGNVNGYAWSPAQGVLAAGNDGAYDFGTVTFDDAGEGKAYFSLATAVGAGTEDDPWYDVNNSDRYGAAVDGEPITAPGSATVMLYAKDVSAMGCLAWSTAPGVYHVTVDLSNATINLELPSGIENVIDATAPAVYYNLQGLPVAAPAPGSIYIMRQGNKAVKVRF